MKDIQTILVMSREDSDLFEKEIPILDFDSDLGHESSTHSLDNLLEVGNAASISMMDWTERLIEMSNATEEEAPSSQRKDDQMTMVTLNFAVTSATDLITDFNSASVTTRCLQREATTSSSDAFYTSNLFENQTRGLHSMNDTLLNAGRDQQNFQWSSSTLNHILPTDTQILSDPHIPSFSNSTDCIPLQNTGSNYILPNSSQTLSETFNSSKSSKADYNQSYRTEFLEQTNEPNPILPVLSLAMLLEEDNVNDDNNVSTFVVNPSRQRLNTWTRTGTKCHNCSASVPKENSLSRHLPSACPPLVSNSMKDSASKSPKINLFDNIVHQRNPKSTPKASGKVSSFFSQDPTISSSDITRSISSQSNMPETDYEVRRNMPETDHEDISQSFTPEVRSTLNWEPEFLSLTDMDIQSEIEVVENIQMDIGDLNTPTAIPKDALVQNIQIPDLQTQFQRRPSQRYSHLQKPTSSFNLLPEVTVNQSDPFPEPFSTLSDSQLSIQAEDKSMLENSFLPQSSEHISFNEEKYLPHFGKYDDNTETTIDSHKPQEHFVTASKTITNTDTSIQDLTLVNMHSSRPFSKPILSELSCDALLSPGDVDRTFLGGTKSQNSQLYSSSFDCSSTDLSSSISSSVPDGDIHEDVSIKGNLLKNKLRSRLKAKGAALETRADIASIETSGSSSTADVKSFASASSSTNTYSSKRKSDDDISEARTSKKSCVSSSSNMSDSESSDEDETTLYFLQNQTADAKNKKSAVKKEAEEEDEETKLAKREKNRIAAQKCRHKKRDRIESLTRQVQRLEGRQDRIRCEVDRLSEEREQLEEMLRVHSFVCRREQHSDK
ncbi:serine-rich adhesin for platelets-like [Biomphalaria glabrata]|uniref:Serine-rich adhesin for platelets-like n=1 Tax=Biomphalaria glabrata TaxID=6526 RepID=A0A9U8E1G3_BIOGL|nr:serine-rich adhesin for platelets-like [Biomphalaria glabrata]